MNPRVKNVVALDNYSLKLTFDNGEAGLYDCSKLLNFGVFKELKNMAYFKRAFVNHDTVAWPNEQDICPGTLYLKSR